MVQLLKEDIQTTEVFAWKGLHLLHAQVSSCSQKLRIYLNIKGLEYTLRPIDIPSGENYGAWYMGINPRGLVPTLVHNGAVIIESNDILAYLERQFTEPPLIPVELADATAHALADEDDLHLDLRALSARYLFPPQAATKAEDAMAAYSANGSGTVGGRKDTRKQVEQAYFRDVNAHGGITEAHTRSAVSRFKAAFEALDIQLRDTSHLLGEDLTVLDIAWYVYCARLLACGYPIQAAHPHVGAWFDRLNERQEFRQEVQIPTPLRAIAENRQNAWAEADQSLSHFVSDASVIR